MTASVVGRVVGDIRGEVEAAVAAVRLKLAHVTPADVEAGLHRVPIPGVRQVRDVLERAFPPKDRQRPAVPDPGVAGGAEDRDAGLRVLLVGIGHPELLTELLADLHVGLREFQVEVVVAEPRVEQQPRREDVRPADHRVLGEQVRWSREGVLVTEPDRLRQAGELHLGERVRVDRRGLGARIAAEQRVVRAMRVIDADVELVPVLRSRRRRHQVVGQPGAGRRGIGVDQLRGDRIPAIGRNDVAGKRLSRERPAGLGGGGERVVDRGDLTEVSAPHPLCRYRRHEHPADFLPEAVVVGKKEGAVLDDRTADGPAELVLLERRLGLPGTIGEEVVRIKAVVAQEAVGHAVEGVAARLGDHVDLSARVASLLGRVEIGLDLEFLDRLDVGTHHDHQRQPGVVVDAVVQIVVGVLAVPVHEQFGAGTQVVGARAAHDRAAHAAAGPRNSGRQRRELHEVAAVQRQLLNLPLLDDRPEDRRLGLEQRGPAHNLDGFAHQPHRQLQVDLGALVDLQLDARPLDLAKPRELDAQAVQPGRQRREAVRSAVASRGDAGDAGGFVGHGDGDARDDAAAGIANGSYQIGRRNLTASDGRRETRDAAGQQQ